VNNYGFLLSKEQTERAKGMETAGGKQKDESMTSVMQTCVLYAEDDPNDAFWLDCAFKNAGIAHPIKVVPDGQRALDYLSGFGPFADRDLHPLPCLILLDIDLPKMNGFEVLEWIRQQPRLKTLPVVMFSDSSDLTDREMARQLAADDYLIKPEDPSGLDPLVKTLRDRWLSASV
jgi:CheY-like chemotaxis protein